MYCWPERDTCSVHADPSQYRNSKRLEGSAYQPGGTDGDEDAAPLAPAPEPWDPQLLEPPCCVPQPPEPPEPPEPVLAPEPEPESHDEPSLPEPELVPESHDEPPPPPPDEAPVDEPESHEEPEPAEELSDGVEPQPAGSDGAAVLAVPGVLDASVDHDDVEAVALDEASPEPLPSRLMKATMSLPAATMLTTDQPSVDFSPNLADSASAS